MPQPLRRWLDDIKFSAAALTERPTLAIGIASVAAAWADVEVTLGILLATILHTEMHTGISMYLALKGSAAQDAVLEAAAEARLSRDLRSEFATLLTSLRKRGRERNKVVHGLWGVSPQMPDVLINCPPENFIRDIKNTYIMGWLIGEKHEPSNDFVRGLMAYSNKDFIDIITRSYELQQQLTAFTNKVGKNAAEQLALIRALERQPESP